MPSTTHARAPLPATTAPYPHEAAAWHAYDSEELCRLLQQLVEKSLSTEQASRARKHRKRKANWATGTVATKAKGKGKVTVEIDDS